MLRLCCTNPVWDSSLEFRVITGGMSKRNIPTCKTLNWPAYNRALKRRGSLVIWFDPDMVRYAKPAGKRGRPLVCSDAAVQT
ncbi:hypothetical protein DWB67_17310 [Paracoccus sp. JM45]|nr:hypothetical protein DWB67_17310 [Paracoccus sp. JM45]